jgi:hypothetical protein
LKEKFGEKGEIYGESRRGEENSEERIKIGITLEEKDSVVTSEEVVGGSDPVAPEDVKYPTGLDMIWPPNVTPRLNNPILKAQEPSLGSPSPSVQSTNMVNSTLNSPIILVVSNHSSPTSSSGRSSSSVESYLVISQPGPSRFILIGSPSSPMETQHAGSLTRYPEFWGKGDEDVEQHWFLCKAIWRSLGTLDANKIVEFQTTLRGCSLKWYMKSIELGNPQGNAFTLAQVKQWFIARILFTLVRTTGPL